MLIRKKNNLVKQKNMKKNYIKHKFNKEINIIDTIIKKNIQSEVKVIRDINNHILNNKKSKKIRPLFTIAIAKIVNYQGTDHYKVAAIIEMIHNATLLHDDVIDNSSLRRGEKTANIIFDNSISILSGDYIYSKAFQLMAEIKNTEIIKIMANTTNILVKGEIIQLHNRFNIQVNETEYLSTIYSKTASIFETTARICGILNQEDKENIEIISKFGEKFGLLFQIKDDLSSYTSDKTKIGKNINDDLEEGRITLPLIYAINENNGEHRDYIKEKIQQKDCQAIRDIVKKSNAIEKTESKIKEISQEAINCLDKIKTNTPQNKELLKNFIIDYMERN